jgi:starch-binding outer membrane protein, SusD/RagB family
MMKRKISFFAIIMLALVSCDKFLEVDSPSSFTDEYIFSHEEDANKAINSIYQCFMEDHYTTRTSLNPNCNTDVEMSGVSAAPDGGRRDIWSFECTSSNSEIDRQWNLAYLAINRANECIEGIKNSVLYADPSNMNIRHMLGEAIALRAYWYNELIRNWGDVPFKTTPTKAGDEFYLPRTDRDTILSRVIQDMIDVEPMMKYADELDYGPERVSREFVQGLIARLSLVRGGYSLRPDMNMKRADDYMKYYQIANTYCKKVIDESGSHGHILNPSYKQIFDNQNKLVIVKNDEMLFEVAYSPGRGEVGYWIGVKIVAGTHSYGSGGGNFVYPPTYVYSFDTLDTRLPVNCSFHYFEKDLTETINSASTIMVGKWCKYWLPAGMGKESTKGTSINWPVMRYSDVLLMLAETENEINGSPTAKAIDALKKVRQRAFPSSVWNTKVDDYVTTASASKSAFFDAIVNERAWEFGGEMVRKADLIRWNLYGKKIAETRAELTQMGIDANTGTGKYANYPDKVYYRNNASGKIEIVGKYRKLPAAPVIKDVSNPDGFTEVSWLKNLYSSTTSKPADFILYNWRGYTDPTGNAPVRYILPIHSSIITSSLGVLKNDGYGYNN